MKRWATVAAIGAAIVSCSPATPRSPFAKRIEPAASLPSARVAPCEPVTLGLRGGFNDDASSPSSKYVAVQEMTSLTSGVIWDIERATQIASVGGVNYVDRWITTTRWASS
jgi:hypothetical protein